jgi:hypothetical protein
MPALPKKRGIQKKPRIVDPAPVHAAGGKGNG